MAEAVTARARSAQDFRGDITRLPIFIAGSKELVMLVGDTFCTRFWCVMPMQPGAKAPITEGCSTRPRTIAGA